MEPIYELEKIWPVRLDSSPASFKAARSKLRVTLGSLAIKVEESCHFGILVDDLRSAEQKLRRMLGTSVEEMYRATVKPFSVELARFNLKGELIEFISPFGTGFFEECSKKYGEGLHHVGFITLNLDYAVTKLINNSFTVVSGEKVKGPRGYVIFLTNDRIRPVHIELCQPL